MAYIITQPCINVKDAACVAVCPVVAIFAEDSVPEQWLSYLAKNRAFFGA